MIKMIKKQWNEIKNNYSNERYQLLKKLTIEIDSIDGIEYEENDFTTILIDEDFYSVVSDLAQVTDNDLEINFNHYGYATLYIDKSGRGLAIIES